MTRKEGGGCHDEVCITCSDQAVAVTVVRLLDDALAIVGRSRPEEVSVALVAAGRATRSWSMRARRSRSCGSSVLTRPPRPAWLGGVALPVPVRRYERYRRVLEEVRQSTVAKAEEIIELRRQVRDRDGGRLLACAGEMADRFAAGGRLFAFGNGGSSSDAQQLASLSSTPARARPPLPASGSAVTPRW